jgi:hypothetical protein
MTRSSISPKELFKYSFNWFPIIGRTFCIMLMGFLKWHHVHQLILIML